MNLADSYDEIIVNNALFVDKSLFIKEYLDSKIPGMLITRPRRFGKSMILKMLNEFLRPELDGN